MKIKSVEIVDQQMDRLKALMRRLRAERRVAFFNEQHRQKKFQSKGQKREIKKDM